MNVTPIAKLLAVLPEADFPEAPSVFEHAWGVTAFVAVYAILVIWLCLMPSRLLREPPGHPWWRSSRLWAILIALFQILVYLGFG